MEVEGILHHVEDVTELEGLFVRQSAVPDLSDAFDHVGAPWTVRAIAVAAKHYQDAWHKLAAENRNLRDVLTSRSTIEQAKGIVMVEQRVGPDAALDLLLRLSQAWNVSLRDVAAAFVYDVSHPPGKNQLRDVS